MSERTRRVDHLLQEEISAIIRRDIHDPRIGFVTITAVEASPDLRHATVWVTVIGSETERRATLAVLGRAMPFVHHRLGSLRLRRIPELHLREDDSAQRGTRVMRLLERLEDSERQDHPPMLEPLPEEPALPTPNRVPAVGSKPAADPGSMKGPDAPLPAGYRRRVDRAALRKARQRRGR